MLYNIDLFVQQLITQTRDSSVGRAVDCRVTLPSIGRWFDSGSREDTIRFVVLLLSCVVCHGVQIFCGQKYAPTFALIFLEKVTFKNHNWRAINDMLLWTTCTLQIQLVLVLSNSDNIQ